MFYHNPEQVSRNLTAAAYEECPHQICSEVQLLLYIKRISDNMDHMDRYF